MYTVHSDTTNTPKRTIGRNPHLKQLHTELRDAYTHHQLDAFGLHVYAMVLMGMEDYQTAAARLLESLSLFVWNWSAWLDWVTCCVRLPDSMAESLESYLQQQWDATIGTGTGTSVVFDSHNSHNNVNINTMDSAPYMIHFALAHLHAERQSHREAASVYERWMPLWGPSPYLYTQYALSQYHLRNFGIAQRLLRDVHEQRPYRLEGMEVYSNILYVHEDAVALCQLAHTATEVDKYRSETCCIVGNYYSFKQQRAKAINSFKRALQIDRSCVSAWTLLGHEYVEWKQTSHAMEAYRRAVQVAPNDYRAWYGLGQTYEFLNLHLHALYYYQKASQLRPYDARMWCALGMTLTHLKRTTDAIGAYERAWQYDDPEGVATQRLAALYRQDHQDEKAAQCYMRHLELRYQVTNAHATAHAAVGQSSNSGGHVSGTRSNNSINNAAAGTSTGGVNANVLSSHDGGSSSLSVSLPPLDVLLQGLVVEGPEAEALLYVAHYHKQHGEYDTAALLASRLLEYPGPEKEQAKALLRDIRARKSHRRVGPSSSRGPPTGASAAAAAAAGGGAASAPESTFEFSP
jgi:anaphase-promoting complex subunit 8